MRLDSNGKNQDGFEQKNNKKQNKSIFETALSARILPVSHFLESTSWCCTIRNMTSARSGIVAWGCKGGGREEVEGRVHGWIDAGSMDGCMDGRLGFMDGGDGRIDGRSEKNTPWSRVRGTPGQRQVFNRKMGHRRTLARQAPAHHSRAHQ
jgi:hypothetical protein